jgi:hypothetical protein
MTRAEGTALVRLSSLEVCALPLEHESYPVYALAVRPLDGGWAITRAGGWCLGRDGRWELGGAHQGDRGDAWLPAHRFALDEALQVAVETAEQLVVRGRTAASVLADDGLSADAAAMVVDDAIAAAREVLDVLRIAVGRRTVTTQRAASADALATERRNQSGDICT